MEEYVAKASKPRLNPIVDGKVKKHLRNLGFSGGEEPQSIYEPDKLFEALQTFGDDKPITKLPEIEFAISKAFKAFGYRDHLPKLLPDEFAYLTRMKLENSGGIYFSTKAASLTDALHRANCVLEGSKGPNPCLAFARTQRNKTRLVWGYPTDMSIIETRFGYRLIDLFKQIRSPLVYALRRVELGARLDSTLKGRNIVGLDFSQFDSHVPASLIRVAFSILKTWFELDEFGERAWRIVVNYFITTPIVMPNGHLYVGKSRGIPSGSLFTNLVGSIVNFILVVAANKAAGYYVPNECIHVCGDDSIYSTNNNVSIKVLASFLLKVGMVLNVEKSTVTIVQEGFKFLGVIWFHGAPYFDDERVWRSGVFPERYRIYPKDDLIASIIAWKSVVLPLMSIGKNLASRLAKHSGMNGPWCLTTQNPLLDLKKGRSGLLDFILEYEPTMPGLWTPLAFPFSC